MNNYIKLGDAINAYNQAVKKLVKNEMEEFDLGDFTECQFNTTQIKLIARMIANLPAIKVNEDCISRKWIADKIICKCFELNDNYDVQQILEDINNAPSVIPNRIEGEWEEKETFHNADDNPIIEEWQSAKCSVCNKYHTTPYMYSFSNYNYCPNCGARMEIDNEK